MFPDSKRAIEGRSDRQAGDETESVSSPLAMARAVADANAGGNANTQRNELDELPPPPYQYDSTSTQISRTEEASNPTTPVEASKETATPAQQSPWVHGCSPRLHELLTKSQDTITILRRSFRSPKANISAIRSHGFRGTFIRRRSCSCSRGERGLRRACRTWIREDRSAIHW